MNERNDMKTVRVGIAQILVLSFFMSQAHASNSCDWADDRMHEATAATGLGLLGLIYGGSLEKMAEQELKELRAKSLLTVDIRINTGLASERTVTMDFFTDDASILLNSEQRLAVVRARLDELLKEGVRQDQVDDYQVTRI